MRNFKDVITQIINILTQHGFQESALVIQLNKLIKDAKYTAPEMMYIKWNQAHELLCENLLNDNNKIDNDWFSEMKLDIFSIFSTTSKEQLRLSVVE